MEPIAQLWDVARFSLEANQSIYRFQRGEEHLAGPMLLAMSNGVKSQLKIVFGETPIIFFEEYTELHVQSLVRIFLEVASQLNKQEAAEGKLTLESARESAATFLRRMILDKLAC